MLADRMPLGRPMLAGLALFALGLVIGGTAPDMLVLVAGRAVQGLGAGVVPAVAYVAISRVTRRGAVRACSRCCPRRGVIPGLIGPAVAALVATAVGWRWVVLRAACRWWPWPGCWRVLALRHVPGPRRGRQAPGRQEPGRQAPGQPTDRQPPAVPYLPVLGVVAGAGVALTAVTSGNLPSIAAGVHRRRRPARPSRCAG